jgi:glutathione S-transferase
MSGGRTGHGGEPARDGIPLLWHLKVSHYNEKARWALDQKGIPHRRRAVTPGAHVAIAERLSGGTTFPILVLDGSPIADSTRIIAALEQRHHSEPLYPSHPAARRRALELEDFFDEQLGPDVRLLVLASTLVRPALMLGTFAPDLTGASRLGARLAFPLLKRRLRGRFDLDPAAIERSYERVRAAGARFRAELEPSGYLVGDSFTVADLTLAALSAAGVAPAQFPYPQPHRNDPLLAPVREAFAESGLDEWTREMYARHRPPSAEIA